MNKGKTYRCPRNTALCYKPHPRISVVQLPTQSIHTGHSAPSSLAPSVGLMGRFALIGMQVKPSMHSWFFEKKIMYCRDDTLDSKVISEVFDDSCRDLFEIFIETRGLRRTCIQLGASPANQIAPPQCPLISDRRGTLPRTTAPSIINRII